MGGLKQAQNALWAFARTIRELPEEDFRRLIKTAAPLEAAALPVKRKLTAFDRPASLGRDECERILHRLMSATTREIGADIVSESFPQKIRFSRLLSFSIFPSKKRTKLSGYESELFPPLLARNWRVRRLEASRIRLRWTNSESQCPQYR